jgi:undecaprenyl-phosphate 4-deoxy-4-formamido-L-arabinose transferase
MEPTTYEKPEVIPAPSAPVSASAMSLSIVIPVYRSASILPELHRRLSAVLEPLGHPYEIILVEDCGGDDSWDAARGLSAMDHHVRAIRLSRNYGQHNALLCGIRAANHDVVVTIDDDLQNPPEEIPKLLGRIAEGHDVVYGTPSREQHGLLRDLASRITKVALQSTMGAETARKVSAFRAFRTELRHAFENYRSPSVNLDVLLTWATSRFTSETVTHAPRHKGDSGYTLRKLISHALNMMTGFSALPLQMASIVGFSFAFFGFGILAYVVGRYLIQGGSVPGFPFLASIIAIFSGAQLFALGIVGEYLARMHFRSMGRPPYSIRETTGGLDTP